jgi:hypothetical protein
VPRVARQQRFLNSLNAVHVDSKLSDSESTNLSARDDGQKCVKLACQHIKLYVSWQAAWTAIDKKNVSDGKSGINHCEQTCMF